MAAKSRTPAAKAVVGRMFFGTAKPVPFVQRFSPPVMLGTVERSGSEIYHSPQPVWPVTALLRAHQQAHGKGAEDRAQRQSLVFCHRDGFSREEVGKPRPGCYR